MPLAKMSAQYVSSRKCNTTNVARMMWIIAVVVGVAGKGSPSFVGLAANGALVHASNPDCEASDVMYDVVFE